MSLAADCVVSSRNWAKYAQNHVFWKILTQASHPLVQTSPSTMSGAKEDLLRQIFHAGVTFWMAIFIAKTDSVSGKIVDEVHFDRDYTSKKIEKCVYRRDLVSLHIDQWNCRRRAPLRLWVLQYIVWYRSKNEQNTPKIMFSGKY